MKILQVKGTSIYSGDQKIHLKGVNYGNWMLLEHYMIGMFWVDYKMRQEFKNALGEARYKAFFDKYMEYYLEEKDFEFIKSCGMNLVKIPFSYRHFENDMRPGEYLEEGFMYLDKVINFCRKYDMYMMPVIFSTPGSQARDPNAESAFGEVLFWDNQQTRTESFLFGGL